MFSTEHIAGLHCHRKFLGSLHLKGGQGGQVAAGRVPAGHPIFSLIPSWVCFALPGWRLA